ncbi:MULTISPECIES: PTS fructose transporter subunit IIC [Tissierellales]|jgi:fructose-specific PTS system IIC-like component|uniref:PTS fructose transporter subunit IIC n=1 Tax=Acidilutibacter cellobiosedens TaxID=2507161 RepID=A0A410Q9W0_9FIRM|nr:MULTISPECIES: PTS fructose transporter subunit IIC [Tissierellales]MBE6081796.1 PTS fructose transporter subunit IIC [Tissierellaceae bacterium]QAT60678.1 PTS fructose transporter subunit IIC [Acidilutibacter cellobiosedens]SCL91259.1 PTS system fructose-like EIIC component 1 [Sporanaerobacter sp. PP17-6a]
MTIKKRTIGVSEDKIVGKANDLNDGKQSAWTEISRHIMTGISYMIPILIMGGLVGAFSQIIPYVILRVDPSLSIIDALNSGQYTGFSEILLKLANVMSTFGFTLFGFAVPMFAAFTANSIGGKTALLAGFIGGYIANNPVAKLSIVNGKWESAAPVASGFLGGVIIAFAVGYFVKWLNKKIKVSHNWLAFKTTFLVPLLTVLFTLIFMVYIVTPVGGAMNSLIKNVLQSAGKSGEMIYAVILSAATAFDLGGPVNKAAGFVAAAFTIEKTLPITARVIAIVTPSIGLGLSTLIDKKLVGRRVYDKQFYQAGKTSIFLAFMGISEGAIPFALERPGFVIPLYVICSVIGSVTAIALGAVQWFPESAIWAWPLIDGIVPYIIGLAVGSILIAVINVLHRNNLIKKGKLEVF